MEKTKRKGRWTGAVVAGVLVAVLAVVSVLSSTMFYSLLNTVMPGGGERAVFADDSEALYVSDYGSKKEAYQAANDLNLRLCEEGMVLLKNENGALPLATPVSSPDKTAKPKVSVFGKNSVNLAYGGSGSGGVDASGAVDLYTALEKAGYEINPVLKAFYEDNGKSGEPRKANSSDLDSGKSLTIATGEAPMSLYTDQVKDSWKDYREAAIVVFTRVGGEGFDLPRYQGKTEGAVAPDSHYLELDQNERDLLAAVCDAGFKHVIVLFNIPSSFEATFLTDPNYAAFADKIDGVKQRERGEREQLVHFQREKRISVGVSAVLDDGDDVFRKRLAGGEHGRRRAHRDAVQYDTGARVGGDDLPRPGSNVASFEGSHGDIDAVAHA